MMWNLFGLYRATPISVVYSIAKDRSSEQSHPPQAATPQLSRIFTIQICLLYVTSKFEGPEHCENPAFSCQKLPSLLSYLNMHLIVLGKVLNFSSTRFFPLFYHLSVSTERQPHLSIWRINVTFL